MVGLEFDINNMKNMDPSCLVSTVQAGGVWDIFLLGCVPLEHCCNARAYLSIVSDHVHPFMTTLYLFSDGYFQQHKATSHKARFSSD